MEEVICVFSSSHISLNESDINLTHPMYLELYRGKPDLCNQEKRRKEWLENLKRKREDQLNLTRGINSDLKEKLGRRKEIKNVDSMDIDQIKMKNVNKRDYKDWIMLSEWLIEVPMDLKENWLCAICPEGVRALVVSEKKTTRAFRRNGRVLFDQFQSYLPGGSEESYRGKAILDTIYNFSTKMFYVLDVLHWGIDTMELQAEMRFYWLKSKLEEELFSLQHKGKSKKKFVCVDHFTYSELQEKMKIYPIFPKNTPKIDGILFYHREGTYVHSRSPLVTWLNPFMLPDILNIKVAQQYMDEKPPQYHKMDVDKQSSTE